MSEENKESGKIIYLAILGIVASVFIIITCSFYYFYLTLETSITKLFNIVFLVIALPLFISSIGVLMKKEWARKTYFYTVICILIIIPLYLLGLFYISSNGDGMVIIVIVPPLILGEIYFISVARYLSKPEIKEYFS